MEWLWKAALSAVGVLLVLAAGQRCGPRAGGSVAAMPLITAPALGWLAHEQGVDFAVGAAVAGIAACAMLSAFALFYALVCRRRGVVTAVLAGSVGAVTMLLPAVAASADLPAALAIALGACGIAVAGLRDTGPPGDAAVRRSGRAQTLLALGAGATTALAVGLGPALGAFAAGLLASVPVISGTVAIAEHAAGRPRAAVHFLRGYVGGLFGRVAFGAVFALLARPTGAPAALGIAVAVACLFPVVRPRRRSIRLAGLAVSALRRPATMP